MNDETQPIQVCMVVEPLVEHGPGSSWSRSWRSETMAKLWKDGGLDWVAAGKWVVRRFFILLCHSFRWSGHSIRWVHSTTTNSIFSSSTGFCPTNVFCGSLALAYRQNSPDTSLQAWLIPPLTSIKSETTHAQKTHCDLLTGRALEFQEQFTPSVFFFVAEAILILFTTTQTEAHLMLGRDFPEYDQDISLRNEKPFHKRLSLIMKWDGFYPLSR